jgi:hypothetical protein
MAKIAAKLVLFKAPVSVGTDEYSAHLNRAEFVPTQPTASFTDLDGKVTNFGGDSGWVLELGGAQDWETVNSLSSFLNAHEGDEIEVSFPFAGSTHTGTAIAAAVNIGGTINTPAVWTKQLQVQGAPTSTPIEG